MTGRVLFKLPFPRVEFDRYAKRRMPTIIGGQEYSVLRRTEEEVYVDRKNTRRNWKRLQILTSQSTRKRIPYRVRYFMLWDSGCVAVIRYGK